MTSFKDLGEAFGEPERKRSNEEAKKAAEEAAAKTAKEEQRKLVDAATTAFATDAYAVLMPAYKDLRLGDPRITLSNLNGLKAEKAAEHRFVKDGVSYQWLSHITVTLENKGGTSRYSTIDIGFARGVDDAAYDAAIAVSRHRGNSTVVIFDAFRPVIKPVNKQTIEATLRKMVEHFAPNI